MTNLSTGQMGAILDPDVGQHAYVSQHSRKGFGWGAHYKAPHHGFLEKQKTVDRGGDP